MLEFISIMVSHVEGDEKFEKHRTRFFTLFQVMQLNNVKDIEIINHKFQH